MRVARELDLVRDIDMTAGNPLHTEPNPTAVFVAPAPPELGDAMPISRREAPPLRAVTSVPPIAEPLPAEPEPAEPPAPTWVDMAAGRAVREPQARVRPDARRPVELEEAARRRAAVDAAARAAAAVGDPGPLYRCAYAMVQAFMFAFFTSGIGLAAYVLLRH